MTLASSLANDTGISSEESLGDRVVNVNPAEQADEDECGFDDFDDVDFDDDFDDDFEE